MLTFPSGDNVHLWLFSTRVIFALTFANGFFPPRCNSDKKDFFTFNKNWNSTSHKFAAVNKGERGKYKAVTKVCLYILFWTFRTVWLWTDGKKRAFVLKQKIWTYFVNLNDNNIGSKVFIRIRKSYAKIWDKL